MEQKVGQLDALTGLRFVAALAVFVHHLGNKFGMPHIRGSIGALAVSFFFVLSGFILTYVYHDRLTRGGIKRFYFTRWARIWPLHLVCLLLVLFVAGKWHSVDSSNEQLKLLLNGLLLQSWAPYEKFIFSFNGVSWSISTELFFYLVFPLFLIGGQRRFWFKYAGLLLITIVALFSLQALANVPTLSSRFDFLRIAQVNPLLRLPEFCTGMAAGYVFFNRQSVSTKRNWWIDSTIELLALGAIVAYAVAFVVFQPDRFLAEASWRGGVLGYWFRFAGGAFLFAAVVFVFATRDGICSRLLSKRCMVFLGEISFAFYMTHMIVIRMVNRYDWLSSPIPEWALAVSCFVISLCLSTLLFKLIEIPTKKALLEAYEGQLKKSVWAVPVAVRQFLQQPVAVAAAVTLVITLGGLIRFYQPVVLTKRAQEIVEQSESVYKKVNFGENVRLIGFATTENAEGIGLNLVWQKMGHVERPRFIHVLDNTGKQVTSLNGRIGLLSAAGPGEVVIDEIRLSTEQMAAGATIVVGFYSKEKGAAVLKPGNRTTGNWRFTLVDSREFVALVRSKNAPSPFQNVSFKD